MKKIHCKFCGKEAPNNMQGYCQACYRYFIIQGKELHEPYKDNHIYYADNGNAICPECGKEFGKLGGHLRMQHHFKAEMVYRTMGINPRKAKASSITYRTRMRVVQDPKTISINLIEKGKKTRIQPGEKFRLKRKEVK